MTNELMSEVLKADKTVNYNVHICFEKHKDTTEEDWYVWLAAMLAIDGDWPFAKWSDDVESHLKKCTECGGYEWIDPIVSPPDFIALAKQFRVKFQQMRWRDGNKCKRKEELRAQLEDCFDNSNKKTIDAVDAIIDETIEKSKKAAEEEEKRMHEWYLRTKAREEEARRYHGEQDYYDPDLGDMCWH